MHLLLYVLNVVEVGTKMILSQFFSSFDRRVGRCNVFVMFWSLANKFITLQI
jgi:hypothetical protein